jgi:hypothetical protein
MVFAASPLRAANMTFGVKGGPTMATGTGDDAEDYSTKVGTAAGAFLCYGISGIFAIQTELLFSMKGAQDNGWLDINGNPISASMNLNYFEIPLLLKVDIPIGEKIEPILYAGPALGILMSAREKFGGQSADIKGLFKTLDIGIVAGAGVAYEIKRGWFLLEARYEIGINTIMDLGDAELAAEGLTGQPDVRNSVSTIMAGYEFAF